MNGDDCKKYPQMLIHPIFLPWLQNLLNWAFDPNNELHHQVVNKYFEDVISDSRLFYLFRSKLITKDGHVSLFLYSRDYDLEGISQLISILKNNHPVFVEALIKTIKDGLLHPEYPPIFENPSNKIVEMFILPKMYEICISKVGEQGKRLFFLTKNKNPRISLELIKFCENAKNREETIKFLEILLDREDDLSMNYLENYYLEDLKKFQLIDDQIYHPRNKYNSAFIKYYHKQTNPKMTKDDILLQIKNNSNNLLDKIDTTNNLVLINNLNLVNIDEQKTTTQFLLEHPKYITFAFFQNNKSKDVLEFIEKHFVPGDVQKQSEVVAALLHNPHAMIENDNSTLEQSKNELLNKQLDLLKDYYNTFSQC